MASSQSVWWFKQKPISSLFPRPWNWVLPGLELPCLENSDFDPSNLNVCFDFAVTCQPSELISNNTVRFILIQIGLATEAFPYIIFKYNELTHYWHQKGKLRLRTVFSVLLLKLSKFLCPFLDAGRCDHKKDAELLVAPGPHLGYAENQQAYCQPLCFPGPWWQFCRYWGRAVSGDGGPCGHLVKKGGRGGGYRPVCESSGELR